MPCYPTLQKKAEKVGIKLPDGAYNDQDVRDVTGAIDHEDLHRILDDATDEQVKELALRLLRRRQRKRAEATARYLAMQHGHSHEEAIPAGVA